MANIKGNYQAILNVLDKKTPGVRRVLKQQLRKMTVDEGRKYLNRLLDLSRVIKTPRIISGRTIMMY